MASYNKSPSLLEENRHAEHGATQTDQPREMVSKKNLAIAYLLWFPFGLLGFHRFYLGYNTMGFVYLFTFGYCGIGWIVDCFCMPSMVKETNEWLEYNASNPSHRLPPSTCSETGMRYGVYKHGFRQRTLRDALILTLNPFGLLGIQHQYLGRPWYRLAYNLTAGLFGFGWLTDIFRISTLVKQANAEIELLRSGTSMTEMKRKDIWDCKTVEAYIFGIPGGIFGMHHFYLGRYGFGFTYLFTFGLFGIGWLVDLLRMPNLVQRSNQERKSISETASSTKYVDDAYILAFTLGIFGGHHFYLNRPGFGVIYFCTLGIFGLGWLVDLIRMPILVREANIRNEQRVTFYHFPANNQYSAYPGNSPYPTAPLQNGHPAHPYPTHNNCSYQTGYQPPEQPPSYTVTVTNNEQPNSQHMKQYPPP